MTENLRMPGKMIGERTADVLYGKHRRCFFVLFYIVFKFHVWLSEDVVSLGRRCRDSIN